jgi:hypothetical protein
VRKKGKRDAQRDKALELIRLAALHGQEHVATRLFVHLRVSRREFNEHLALGRSQREGGFMALGENQKRVLCALRRRPTGWYQGCSMVVPGVSVPKVMGTLERLGMVAAAPVFVPNRGTQDVYTLTEAGMRIANAIAEAKEKACAA